MFIVPCKNRYSFWVDFLKMDFAKIIDWLVPKLGRKVIIGVIKIEINRGFRGFIFGLIIFCLGIFILFFIEFIIEGAPNKPDKSGRRGFSWLFKFKAKSPSIADKRIIVRAFILFFCFKIKKSSISEIIIERFCWINGFKNSIVFIIGIRKIKKKMTPKKLP